ncbi:hypothetical protein HOLleu_33618 [Holothuria leucospilota]|uniref:Uncharacterized protein n=1 Tax=Holothuria leucospilota TaxID=206669 RepID=A0A9Q0YNZ6_HOLLE|nr:hypothetical protein HOLleu_33618 [Holothuria leucospilota]
MSAGDSTANSADHQIKPHVVYTETFGAFHCYVQGNLSSHKVVCVTYHDIGLNHSAFIKFLDTNDMSAIKSRMCFVHINAPGQQDNAEKLAENYHFPTMQQLADVIPYVLKEVGVTDNHDLIGFGEGAGANILLRFSFSNPRVLGLILLECTSTAAGFMEWGQEKVASWNLTHRGMNPTAEKYLLWHHLGTHSSDMVDIVNSYRANLYERMNAHNLALFIDKFTNRNNVTVNLKDVKCPVLLATGKKSPHYKDVEQLFEHLSCTKNILCPDDVHGDIKEEAPSKLAESIILFLQGIHLLSGLPMRRLGRTPSLGETSKERTSSMSEMDRPEVH